jgi:hypothetical protein
VDAARQRVLARRRAIVRHDLDLAEVGTPRSTTP